MSPGNLAQQRVAELRLCVAKSLQLPCTADRLCAQRGWQGCSADEIRQACTGVLILAQSEVRILESLLASLKACESILKKRTKR